MCIAMYCIFVYLSVSCGLCLSVYCTLFLPLWGTNVIIMQYIMEFCVCSLKTFHYG